MISFFPERSQWNDYEKENDDIHYERSQQFFRTRIRPVPKPYQEQRQQYYRREEDDGPLHWRGRLYPFLYLGLHRPLFHYLHPLRMLILIWVPLKSVIPTKATLPLHSARSHLSHLLWAWGWINYRVLLFNALTVRCLRQWLCPIRRT